ncbi:MAG: CpsD/CapB family tyrosine-protein kinase [Lachnospiraceae bacterium]|nr:CpsD/CapB family tyrosine-protein kinase [Lachnospiraceae bacterium]MBR6273472.1 CpsD/CapB family tyrosine-protein kinase [Lachnospiraceae bacterium]
MEKLDFEFDLGSNNREREVYRTLRTNIEFTGLDNQVICVTSCTPDDGKTTVSFNLATALAEGGKTTLYVDADLRKSVLMQRLSIKKNPKGLSHYLSSQAALQNVIYMTKKQGFFVMPTGVFPSNPTELLGNGRLDQMVESAKKIFDYVIIDTPPLGNVIDAAVVAKSCDATLLVIASDVSSRTMVRGVVNQLKISNPNFLGVVLNKVDMKSNGYYGKKYGGYYGKGYSSYYGASE